MRTYGGIVGSGGDGVPAGIESDGVDVCLVSLEALHAASAPHVPDHRQSVAALHSCRVDGEKNAIDEGGRRFVHISFLRDSNFFLACTRSIENSTRSDFTVGG